MVKYSNLAEINGLCARRVKLQGEIKAHVGNFKKLNLLLGSKMLTERRLENLGVILDQ